STEPKASPMANTPIATTMKSMPPRSVACPKMKRDCAVNRSVPMLVSHSPSSSDRRPLISELPDSSTTSARPRHISAKYSGELNDSANAATGGATSVSPITPTVPATNDAIARKRSAGPGAPLAAHVKRGEAGNTRRRSAGIVEQDGGGGPAIFGAVVDAGQHDDPAGRVHLEGERQQQRNGGRRAKARQDAHDGAKQAAHEAPDDVARLQRDCKSVQEARRNVHLRTRTDRRGASRPAQ